VRTISLVVKRKLEGLGEISRESCGGVRSTANMLNRLDATMSSQILDEIEAADPKMLDSIRRLMFIFNDLQYVELEDMRQLVAKVNNKTLTVALKGCDPKLMEKVMSCMSGRAAEMLREDISAQGSVKPQDVDTAQQEIIGVARQLEKEGVITLKKSK
jgi:flagellar motor switch protein FliG